MTNNCQAYSRKEGVGVGEGWGEDCFDQNRLVLKSLTFDFAVFQVKRVSVSVSSTFPQIFDFFENICHLPSYH